LTQRPEGREIRTKGKGLRHEKKKKKAHGLWEEKGNWALLVRKSNVNEKPSVKDRKRKKKKAVNVNEQDRKGRKKEP